MCSLLMLLPAMGPSHAAGAKDKESARVLATVNGVDITQGEVDMVYERTGVADASAQAADARKRLILADLVRSEAMAQWTVESGIDAPDQTATEARLVRRQLLAARADRAAQAAVPPLPAQELKAVLANNPLVFAQRRQYTLEEVQIRALDGKLFAQIDDAVKNQNADLDKAERMAMDAGATTERRVISMGSEAMPVPVMEALASARVGQLFVVQSGADRGWVLALRAAVNAPLVGDQALRVATGLAAEQMRRAAVQARSQEVLSRARIKYSEAVIAMSAAASSPPAALAPSPAASAGSEVAGPLIIASDAEADKLPQGRAGYGRRAIAKMVGVGTATVLAGTLAIFAVFAVVRFAYERFWLPRLWPLSMPEPTPKLAEIVLEAMLHPPRLDLTARAARWLVNLGLLGCALALALAFTAAQRVLPGWTLGLCAAAGWALGIVALYRFTRSTARDATRAWRGLTALCLQAMVLLLAGSARWL